MPSIAQFDAAILEAYELLEAKHFRGCVLKCRENVDTPNLGDWWIVLYVLLARCARDWWSDDKEYHRLTAGTTLAYLEMYGGVNASDVYLEDLDRLRDRYERLALARGDVFGKS
jgi:hypothetical protein